MAVSMYRKRSKSSKKQEAKQSYFGFTILYNFLSRISVLVFLIILIYTWSSLSTIITGNIIHVCISTRKLNSLYCLSAGTHPSFEIPTSTNNYSSITPQGNATEPGKFPDTPYLVTSRVDNNNGDEEVENGVKAIEEQLHIQRSLRSGKNYATCDGQGIYVYDLPSKFNKGVVAHCHDMVPWQDLCNYFTNEGLGEPIAKLGKGWYQTHQYSLELIFHSRVLKHPCRVHDENAAKLFFVPFYGGLDILRWHFKNVSNDVKDSLGLELVRWLERQGPWKRNSGKDHVFVLGKISWDFRRFGNSSWGTRLLELDKMQNPIKLLIERQPWHVNDIGIPHPTNFHPHSDNDIIAWQVKMIKSNRKNLVTFAGAARADKDNIRSILIDQCTSYGNGKCQFLNCSSVKCDEAESFIGLFVESELCLQPPGDSPTRKSFFDSLISGCIPVLFDPFTAYYQYAWHLPQDHGKYSVFIDKKELTQMNVNVMERLANISSRERENMRRYVIYELFPALVYGDYNSELDKFQDAFTITVNNLLERG
ncbi:hypothetical protein VNO77_41274 [Canavalia gladiata]|uniref:Exostosin GT47 domain-containing protein n=1 Tax=Canavalia gladiata TaxID=3824 RepID=A0AAN9JZT3_CANGL